MRYLPHTEAERASMLARIGVDGIDGLFADIPADRRLGAPLDLGPRLFRTPATREIEPERWLSLDPAA